MAKTETLYHSQLCKMGTVEVKVKSDITQSKYPNKPPYVTLVIGGKDYYYNLDSDDCARFFEGRKGDRVVIVASGDDREGTAAISEGDPDEARQSEPDDRESRRPATSQPGRTAPPRRQTAPRKLEDETEEQAVGRVKAVAMRLANLHLICFLAARHEAEQVKKLAGIAWDADMLRAATSSMFISASRMRLQDRLPCHDISPVKGAAKPSPAPKDAKSAAPAPPPEDPPLTDPEDDVPF